MDRETLMRAVATRALEARITLHALCKRAQVSRTIAARWQNGEGTPSLPTIGKLEREIAAVERDASREL